MSASHLCAAGKAPSERRPGFFELVPDIMRGKSLQLFRCVDSFNS